MVTKIKDNKIIIEIDLNNKNVDEKILSFLSSLEISNKSQATEEDILKFSEEISDNWWQKNKKRFLSEDNN